MYMHFNLKGSVNYKDKDVLILGGGDGALLWELLQVNSLAVRDIL